MKPRSFHQFTNPECDKSFYFWLLGSYLLCKLIFADIAVWSHWQIRQMMCSNSESYIQRVRITCYLNMSHSMTKSTKWHAPSEDSDQPGQLPSLIRGFTVCWMGNWGLDIEDWSVWADAQDDLSLRWVHMSFSWFCLVMVFAQKYPKWGITCWHDVTLHYVADGLKDLV